MKFLFVLLLLLTGCSSFEGVKPPYIDLAIVPYLDSYKADKLVYTGSSFIRRIDISFDTMAMFEGLCTIYSDGTRKITISPYDWFSGDDASRIITLYHEMGHCDLDLEHTTDDSIMNKYGMSTSKFATDRQYYLRLLFMEGK
jgi:hypothetical protein